jgi:hypothetical protein
VSYWKVGTNVETLAYFVWADNAQHAQRAIEQLFGPMPNGRAVVKAVNVGSIPAGYDVFNEPDQEREERVDGEEQE